MRHCRWGCWIQPFLEMLLAGIALTVLSADQRTTFKILLLYLSDCGNQTRNLSDPSNFFLMGETTVLRRSRISAKDSKNSLRLVFAVIILLILKWTLWLERNDLDFIFNFDFKSLTKTWQTYLTEGESNRDFGIGGFGGVGGSTSGASLGHCHQIWRPVQASHGRSSFPREIGSLAYKYAGMGWVNDVSS